MNGVRVFGLTGGRPVLWCHGGLSSAGDAALLHQPAREAGIALIAVDRPGIGGAPRRRCPTVRAWTDIALEALDGMDVGPFAAMGWSAGGPYALAVAAAAPARVESVATLAAMHPLTETRYRTELGFVGDPILLTFSPRWPTVTRLMLSPLRLVGGRALAWTARRSALPSERARLAAMGPELAAALAGATAQGVRGVVEDYGRLARDWDIAFDRIQARVTVWHGSDDPWVPVSHARDLATLVGAELRELDRLGHFLPVTAGAAILADVVDGAA